MSTISSRGRLARARQFVYGAKVTPETMYSDNTLSGTWYNYYLAAANSEGDSSKFNEQNIAFYHRLFYKDSISGTDNSQMYFEFAIPTNKIIDSTTGISSPEAFTDIERRFSYGGVSWTVIKEQAVFNDTEAFRRYCSENAHYVHVTAYLSAIGIKNLIDDGFIKDGEEINQLALVSYLKPNDAYKPTEGNDHTVIPGRSYNFTLAETWSASTSYFIKQDNIYTDVGRIDESEFGNHYTPTNHNFILSTVYNTDAIYYTLSGDTPTYVGKIDETTWSSGTYYEDKPHRFNQSIALDTDSPFHKGYVEAYYTRLSPIIIESMTTDRIAVSFIMQF
jgi:hypothetical protein